METNPERWFCEQCGTENNENFCIRCGRSRPSVLPERNEQSGDILTSETSKPLPNNTKAIPNPNALYAVMAILLVAFIGFMGNKIYNQFFEAKETKMQQYTANQQLQKTQDAPIKHPSENSAGEQTNAPVSSSSPEISRPTMPNKTADTISANQREAINALYSFHDNITHKEYRQAYNCLSPGLQSRMSYDGWIPGFKTTVSSIPSDVKVASETANKIVLTYNLKAVDNPGGTQNFSGTVTVVRTGDGWKLDEITNKVKK